MSPAEQSLLIAADTWVRRMTDNTQVLRAAYADNVLLMRSPGELSSRRRSPRTS